MSDSLRDSLHAGHIVLQIVIVNAVSHCVVYLKFPVMRFRYKNLKSGMAYKVQGRSPSLGSRAKHPVGG